MARTFQLPTPAAHQALVQGTRSTISGIRRRHAARAANVFFLPWMREGKRVRPANVSIA